MSEATRQSIITLSTNLPNREEDALSPLEFWTKVREWLDLADEEGIPSEDIRIWASSEIGKVCLNLKGHGH